MAWRILGTSFDGFSYLVILVMYLQLVTGGDDDDDDGISVYLVDGELLCRRDSTSYAPKENKLSPSLIYPS